MNICKCKCHKKNNVTMFFTGCFCCDISEQQYIEADGTIDEVTLFRILHPEPPRKRHNVSKKELKRKIK